MHWFFGLKGITCFNCGGSHHGSQCDRPRVEDCARNGELVLDELDRAGARSLSEEVEFKKKQRGNDNNRDRDSQLRARSQPQKKKFCIDMQSSNYGRILYTGQQKKTKKSQPK